MTKAKVLVAPSSTHGHYVSNAKKVISLDEINETFLVEVGDKDVTLDTSSHTSLEIKEDCLITCQTVYDPFAGAFVKSKD